MSNSMLEFTGYESRLKGFGIEIIAEAPDDQKVTVFVPGEDVRLFYELNPAAFQEKFGDDIKTLEELFMAVAGIHVTEIN